MKKAKEYIDLFQENHVSSTGLSDEARRNLINIIRSVQLEAIDEAIRVLEEELDSALAFDSIPDFDEIKQKLYQLKKYII